jgi:hypothetical protein
MDQLLSLERAMDNLWLLLKGNHSVRCFSCLLGSVDLTLHVL